jgi:hypothetical protein
MLAQALRLKLETFKSSVAGVYKTSNTGIRSTIGVIYKNLISDELFSFEIPRHNTASWAMLSRLGVLAWLVSLRLLYARNL